MHHKEIYERLGNTVPMRKQWRKAACSK